ncbi:MAG: hypothetical protein NTY20_05145 [Candidatus Aenigmarchaeota archaeon]|nr:hypothetical protein [Candidatus Aenigmarchaeota archaeon]
MIKNRVPKIKKDFRDECFEQTVELTNLERMYRPKLELYIKGTLIVESEVPHGTDTDYVMIFELDSHSKTSIQGPVTLPNDEEETADGAAYVCRQLTERLNGLRAMNTILGAKQTRPHELEIYERK